jgi:hypothetical protein
MPCQNLALARSGSHPLAQPISSPRYFCPALILLRIALGHFAGVLLTAYCVLPSLTAYCLRSLHTAFPLVLCTYPLLPSPQEQQRIISGSSGSRAKEKGRITLTGARVVRLDRGDSKYDYHFQVRRMPRDACLVVVVRRMPRDACRVAVVRRMPCVGGKTHAPWR